jgi:hypothetical protein
VKIDPRTPVIVGAGQVVHREPTDAECCEPVAMMVEALRLAGRDSGTGSGCCTAPIPSGACPRSPGDTWMLLRWWLTISALGRGKGTERPDWW